MTMVQSTASEQHHSGRPDSSTDGDPFVLDITVTAHADGSSATPGCNTDDGCGTTCASACNSNVDDHPRPPGGPGRRAAQAGPIALGEVMDPSGTPTEPRSLDLRL